MTWKPVVGWEGWFEVSDHGDLRSVTRRVEYSNGSTRIYKGQNKRIHTDRYGYARGSLNRPGKSETCQMHVLVCEAFHGPRPSPDAEVCHANDIRDDNRAENLSWGTRQSNAREMAERNRIKGERHPRQKLTAFQVFMLRESSYDSISQLARKFGVARGTMHSVVKGKNWIWL